MKVLKGSFKGVELTVPEGGIVRPTVDHFKKHILRISEEKKPLVVWDLFAGGGGVGIELLSGGAKKALFIEQWGKAIECIKLNLGECHLKDQKTFQGIQYQILNMTVESFLKDPSLYNLRENPDLVFLDPPYGQKMVKKIVPLLLNCPLITPQTLILAEHVVEDPIDDLEDRGELLAQEVYGPKILSCLKRHS